VTKPLQEYFPDYTGGADVKSTSSYLCRRFTTLGNIRLASRELYVHVFYPGDTQLYNGTPPLQVLRFGYERRMMMDDTVLKAMMEDTRIRNISEINWKRENLFATQCRYVLCSL
jgi:hypothetical protein